MAHDLMQNKLLSYPSLAIPSIWNDDDEWLTSPSSPSGLSISEDEKSVYIDASLPGIDPKNIDITFHDGYLWIKGEIKEEDQDKNRKYYRKAVKSFSYRVAVPGDIDTAIDPKATYKHGVMNITFMKSPKSHPKRIEIELSKGE